MKTDSVGREKEIANFCTDLSVIWRKYASDRPFRKFALDDVDYI